MRRALAIAGATWLIGTLGMTAHPAWARGILAAPRHDPGAAPSATREPRAGKREPPAPKHAQRAPRQAPRAPSGPPLATATGLGGGMSGSEEGSAAAPAGGGEPLAGNGLRSPLCEDGEGDLPASAVRDCRATMFEAAQAPSGDYAFDVHIDTGLSHTGNYLPLAFQDTAQLVWTSLVAIVHGLIVLLDWCFALDLLNSPAMGGVSRALRATQATFTQPWLAAMLALASIGALYHGLIRRRVAQTLGEAALMAAMMAGGLWVIVNPAGTVGVLGAWATEVSLGALGAVMAGTPAHPRRTLAEANQYVFSSAIGGPWCYLEFNDVSWCENPARLEPKLRGAALGIAKRELTHVGCKAKLPAAIAIELGMPVCVPAGSAQAKALQRSAQLLRSARTNGELFLALPANGRARNSINEEWSLYRALCGGGEPCSGPAAAQAEARTERGTEARMVGLALIAAGLLGMILLLGSIALRLLHAAIVSLVCLLLTPLAVLAPALGEGGRNAFRAWATRLLGAVLSKVVFAFLLGAVLETERTLASVGLGWWTQWVLISTMWWVGFFNRHRLLDFTRGERGGSERRGRSILGRANGMLESRKGMAAARMIGRRLSRPAPDIERRRLAWAGRQRAQTLATAQAERGLQSELGHARTLLEAEPEMRQAIADKQARLERVRRAHAEAQRGAQAARPGTGQRSRQRRAASLAGRMERLRREIDAEQGAIAAARQAVRDAERAQRTAGRPYTREQLERHGRLLDAQAALAAGERDYARLAGVMGLGRSQYEALDAPGRRAARLQIDRELALRRELPRAVAELAAGGPSAGRRERRRASEQLRGRLEDGLRAEGRRPPSIATGGQRIESWKRDGAAGGVRDGAPPGRSPVMDDAREVAARRKRQLGVDRP
jgi:hypothetical protein